MKHIVKLFLFILNLFFLLSLSVIYCQNNEPINLKSNWEVWYDKVPVSGDIRVGVMADQNNESIDPTTFYILIPEHTEKYLFCEFSSIDGRYEASVNYDISNLNAGVHKFILPTKHVSALKNYSYSDIAILTSIVDNFDYKASYFISASWKPITSFPEYIYVYLNSERPTTIVLEDKLSKSKEEFKCNRVENPSSIAYNKVCRISSKTISINTEIFVKQRIRRMKKISYNSYPITLKLPTNETR